MVEARRQVEVNLFGLARLCQLAAPMMRAQTSGTIVNVSSIGGRFGEPFGGWYHTTKFAVEGFSDCLRLELKPFGVRVIVIEPGAIKTEWGGIAMKSLLAASGDTAYAPYARRHAGMFAQVEVADRFASPPDVVARGIMRAVEARNPKARYAIGGGAKIFMALVTLLPTRWLDRLTWRLSQSAAPI